MTFSKFDKVLAKNLYELQGYNAHQVMMEFLNRVVAAVEKRWYGQPGRDLRGPTGPAPQASQQRASHQTRYILFVDAYDCTHINSKYLFANIIGLGYNKTYYNIVRFILDIIQSRLHQ